MGGFIFSLLYPFIIFASALVLGVLVASMAIFVTNMKDGTKKKWPGKNIAGSIISALFFIVAVITAILLIMHVTSLFSYTAPTSSSAPASSTASALFQLISWRL